MEAVEQCCICKETMRYIVFVMSACRHSFHEDCIRTWAHTKRMESGSFDSVTCPECRTPLDPADMNFLSPAHRHFKCQASLQPIYNDSKFRIVVYEIRKDSQNREEMVERINYDLGDPKNLPMVSDQEHRERRWRAFEARYHKGIERGSPILPGRFNLYEELEML